MKKGCLLTVIFFFCSLSVGWGQEPLFLQYTIADGLPSNMVYDIYSDTKGYLWFGTDNGIARYNGIYFETYSTTDGLPSNDIFYFKEDYENRMWISTYNGELCYYKEGKFYNAANADFLSLPFTPSDIKFITLHSDSSLSFAFTDQYHRFVNIKGEELRIINIRNGDQNPILDIEKPSPGIYDIVTADGVMSVDSNGKLLQAKAFKRRNTYYVTYAHDSAYLFNTTGMINRDEVHTHNFNKLTDRVIRISLIGNIPYIGTDKGLIVEGNRYLPGEEISAVTQDVNGNIWIATLGKGVYKAKKNYRDYVVYKQVYDGSVNCSGGTPGGLLFGTSANKLYRLHNGSVRELAVPKTLVGNGLQGIHNGSFYTLSGKKLLAVNYRQKHSESKVYNVDIGPSILKKMTINDTAIYIHQLNAIGYAEYGKENPQSISTAPGPRIYCMAIDDSGSIWYAAGGMYKMAGPTSTLQQQFSAHSFRWFGFFGKLFIGITQTGRLIASGNPEGEKLKYIAIDDSCKWNNVYRISPHSFLFSTDGLYRLMNVTWTGTDSVNYTMSVIDNEFIPRDVEHLAIDSSSLYFFKAGDCYVIPLRELFSRNTPPVITQATFKTTKGYYDTDHPIKITHTEAGNILLGFSAISFDSKNLLYEYSVSKDETEYWNTGVNRELSISTLGYGNYTIKLRPVIPSGVKGAAYVLNVTVLKPFYLQWWFIASVALLVLAVVSGIVRFRFLYLLNRREKEHHVKMTLIKSEYKALNALMNPHFIFNSLNSIQAFINKGNKSSANLYLNLFAKLMRQNMHNISRELIPLDEEIELVKNYLLLEKMRFNDHFDYRVEVDESLDSEDIFIPPLLIQPLVENAIKHGLLPKAGDDNKLWIKVRIDDAHLVIDVEDNGVGFKVNNTADARHSSFALKNIHARISQLNDLYDNAIRLDMQSSVGTGTNVRVLLDINKLIPEH